MEKETDERAEKLESLERLIALFKFDNSMPIPNSIPLPYHIHIGVPKRAYKSRERKRAVTPLPGSEALRERQKAKEREA